MQLSVYSVGSTDDHKEAVQAARSEWNTVSEKLKSCIRQSVVKCQEKGTMNKEQSQKYFWSGKRQSDNSLLIRTYAIGLN